MQNPQIEFINHASVIVSNGEQSVLSDPWYQGDAFHKGWNLLHEFNDNEINNLLDRVTHIWISHEHPDHFSISFFKKFKQKITDRNIFILFQQTDDKRVESFLRGNKFSVRILEFNKWIELGSDFKVLNFKDGFYDSGLAIQTLNKKILNLNDCEVKTKERCNEILNHVGECDVMISQFSYAAWKGGKANISWRKKAASEKLATLELQANKFKPKYLIPFASYVYFSNKKNFYLNDCSNKPGDVINFLTPKIDAKIKIMMPFEKFNFQNNFENEKSLNFWNEKFNSIKPTNQFNLIELEDLQESFKKYTARIFKNNSKFFIRLSRLVSPISVFKPIIIHLDDHNINVSLDIMSESIKISEARPDVEMSSESLFFIMQNTFGFDTLTVNGCFEEISKNGFSKMTKSLAIENLNNIGIKFNFFIIFNFKLIHLFIGRLFSVSKNLKYQK